MVKFEIDVSGSDILEKNYTICVADNNSIIKGFKFSKELCSILSSKYGQGLYKKYKKSQQGKVTFKLRLYSIAIYYIFKSLNIKEFDLKICKDYDGKENDIKSNLKFLLEDRLNLKINEVIFTKLEKDSNAHIYADLMRKDKNNKLNTYTKIELKDFEKLL